MKLMPLDRNLQLGRTVRVFAVRVVVTTPGTPRQSVVVGAGLTRMVMLVVRIRGVLVLVLSNIVID